MHLSRNNMLHEYKETEEEVLITIFKEVLAVHKSADASERNVAKERATSTLHLLKRSQDKNARLQKVLANDPMCLLLSTTLLQLGPHFRHRREFSVTWLAKSLDVCMGVSTDQHSQRQDIETDLMFDVCSCT
jgi:hypothetical protein